MFDDLDIYIDDEISDSIHVLINKFMENGKIEYINDIYMVKYSKKTNKLIILKSNKVIYRQNITLKYFFRLKEFE